MFKRDRAVRYQIVDVFSVMPFSGNPAGVIVNAASLDDKAMQQIAKEMNIANTSFLFQPQNGGDIKIRYFCPGSEINMCGHATIGSVFAWCENNPKGFSKNTCDTIMLETKIGTIPANVKYLNGDVAEVGVRLPDPEFYVANMNRRRLIDALNIDPGEVVDEFPFEVVNSGLRFVEIGIKDKNSLLNIKPKFNEIQSITEEMNIDSVQVFTLDTIEKNSTALSRTFFPRYGVDEDPVCGTGNAALASYLIHNNIVDAKGEKVKIIGEQGHSVSRPGKVRVEATYENNKIGNVLIAGSAVLVFEGYVFVN